MSHVVVIRTEVRDLTALRAACLRLKFPAPAQGTFSLYSGEASGWAVRLPAWRYPVVCEVTTGQIRYDHYEGRWGDPQHLDRLLLCGVAVVLHGVDDDGAARRGHRRRPGFQTQQHRIDENKDGYSTLNPGVFDKDAQPAAQLRSPWTGAVSRQCPAISL